MHPRTFLAENFQSESTETVCMNLPKSAFLLGARMGMAPLALYLQGAGIQAVHDENFREPLNSIGGSGRSSSRTYSKSNSIKYTLECCLS